MPTVDRIYYELGQSNDENNDPRSAEIHYLVGGAEFRAGSHRRGCGPCLLEA